MNSQEKIYVVAAVLTDRLHPRTFFIAERADGGGWEFPGGKVEIGEDKRDALQREIVEELNCSIEITEWLGCSEVSVGSKIIVMDLYVSICDPTELILREHISQAWISPDEIDNYDWAPADIPLLSLVREYIESDNNSRYTNVNSVQGRKDE
jgi:8-oxo-dGTP diphosphatase